MIGGNGNRTVGIAARRADWWNADLATPEVFKEKVALLRDKSVAAGRAADAVRPTAFNMVSISRDPDKVMRDGPRPGIHMIAGTPDEVRDQIAEYRDAGVTYMQINFMDFPDSESLYLFEEIAKDFASRSESCVRSPEKRRERMDVRYPEISQTKSSCSGRRTPDSGPMPL